MTITAQSRSYMSVVSDAPALVDEAPALDARDAAFIRKHGAAAVIAVSATYLLEHRRAEREAAAFDRFDAEVFGIDR